MVSAARPTDEEIIQRIRQGDQKMLILLYKRNLDTLRSYVLRNSGNAADLEDVMQEALVVLWQKVQKKDFQLGAKLDTYLYAVAKNIWMKQLRKMGRMSSHDFTGPDSEVQADDTPPQDTEQAEILSRYLSKLGETCRQLLSLFYFEQLDMEQIAQMLNFANADTAKAKKYQCKKKLEELIRSHFNASDLL